MRAEIRISARRDQHQPRSATSPGARSAGARLASRSRPWAPARRPRWKATPTPGSTSALTVESAPNRSISIRSRAPRAAARTHRAGGRQPRPAQATAAIESEAKRNIDIVCRQMLDAWRRAAEKCGASPPGRGSSRDRSGRATRADRVLRLPQRQPRRLDEARWLRRPRRTPRHRRRLALLHPGRRARRCVDDDGSLRPVVTDM